MLDSVGGNGTVMHIIFNDPDLFEPRDIAVVQNARVRDMLEFTSKEGQETWRPYKCACTRREMGSNLCMIEKDGLRFKMVDMNEES